MDLREGRVGGEGGWEGQMGAVIPIVFFSAKQYEARNSPKQGELSDTAGDLLDIVVRDVEHEQTLSPCPEHVIESLPGAMR